MVIFGVPLLGVVLGLAIAGVAIFAYVGPRGLSPTAVDILINLGGLIALVSFVLFLINIPIAIYLTKSRRRTALIETP